MFQSGDFSDMETRYGARSPKLSLLPAGHAAPFTQSQRINVY
jgi:hypothetical protein